MSAAVRAVSVAVVLAWPAAAPAQENVEAPVEVELPGDGADGATGEGTPEAAGPRVEPWAGTFAEGMAEVLRLAASDDPAAALAVTDRLLEPTTFARWRARLEERTGAFSERALGLLDGPLTFLGYEAPSSADRAEVRFARGLLHARLGAVTSADEELELARVLAGPGRTRRDAVYALGVLDLAVAEALRQKIPEIAGAAAAPPVAPAPPGAAPGATDEPEPDPLELARVAYEQAREHLVERLRLDWRDADTRANVELVQRRLRELDEIERQREQQQREQEQQQQQQEREQQDQEEQEGEQSDPQDEEPRDRDASEEEQPPEEQEEQEEQEQPQEQEGEPGEEGEPEEQPVEVREQYLTEEEMKRLLELLEEYQQQGEELERRLEGARRERVEKDW